MGLLVRVNRNRPKGCWTVFSLVHNKRVGNAEGLLLKNVTFRCQGAEGWAEGELVSWNHLEVYPGFPGRVKLSEERPDGRLIFWPLVFEPAGYFRLKGFGPEPRPGCLWLRARGSYAEATAALATATVP